MHILVMPTAYPSLARPHQSIFYREQAEVLQDAGHKVGVLAAPRIVETLDYIRRYRHLPDLRTAVVEDDSGMPVYRMHWGWFPRVFPRICAWLTTGAALRAFARYCAEQGTPQVIHAHNIFYSGYMAAQIKERFGIPVVLTEHSSNFLRGRIFLPGQQKVTRITLEKVDYPAAVSGALAKELETRVPGKHVQILPNSVDTDFFCPHKVSGGPFVVSIIASLIPLKRVDLLIRAFHGAFAGQDAQLRIGGDGPERRRLERLAAHLGLNGQVVFCGRLSRQQVKDELQRSHVVVSSSEFETFGITLIEAMACGKPVIATRSGGPESIVAEQTGLLVPVGDMEALAEALRQMRQDYAHYDSGQIRAFCEGHYSRRAVARRLQTIYSEVIAGRG